MSGFKWSPIEDLPSDTSSLTDAELKYLGELWIEQRDELNAERDVDEFNRRLSTEWAIETGVVEGVYKLDQGTTETLIEKGIRAELIPRDKTDRDPLEVATILEDHVHVLDGLFAFVKGERNLSSSYICELHAELLRHSKKYVVKDSLGNLYEKELVPGRFKEMPNNPHRPDGTVHEYCPPEHVQSEIDRLIEWHHLHLQRDVPIEVEAAWLHHRFTQIHPFPDGNGRVARTLASIVFIRHGLFPALVTRDDKVDYIGALEDADAKDCSSLTRFFVQAQRKCIFAALQSLPRIPPSLQDSYDSRKPASVEDQIKAARDLFVLRGVINPRAEDWQKVGRIVGNLNTAAINRFNDIANALKVNIGRFAEGVSFSVANVQRNSADPLLAAISDIVRSRRYTPDFSGWTRCVDLVISDKGTKSVIVVNFHGMGKPFRGVVCGVVVVSHSRGAYELAGDDIFQINYREDENSARERFVEWLERGLVVGLQSWRESL